MPDRIRINGLEGDALVEYLLDRKVSEAKVDVAQHVGGRTVMVTGAGGSIGAVLCRQLLAMRPKTLILYEMSEFALYKVEQSLLEGGWQGTQIVPVLGDVCDPDRLDSVLSAYRVDFVFHAAAYKHVPMVEKNPTVGVVNNTIGTATLAHACGKHLVKRMVMISTDKAVRPTSVMGASKKLAELYCLSVPSRTKFTVVRFGNVMWSAGSVLPLFLHQIETTKRVTITDPEVTRFFMSLHEAVRLVLEAAFLKESGIFVLDMGEPVKILDLAHRLIALTGNRTVAEGGDIAIDIIGLREGEKLYEELTLGEKLQPTDHPLIMEAREKTADPARIDRAVRDLAAASIKGDAGLLRALLLEHVPDYNPQCGIVDELWIEQYVRKAFALLPDCYEHTP